MDGSLLHRLKALAHSIVPVPSDALLVVAGLACYLGTCLIARQPLHWAWALVPGLCLSLALEGWEMWDFHGAQGLAKASAGDVLATFLRHSRDVLVANGAPALVLAVALWVERSPRP